MEAFHATLEEVVEADLLVVWLQNVFAILLEKLVNAIRVLRDYKFLQHVLDSSAPNLDEHREAVMQVLEKLGVSQEKLQNMIEVWNKVHFLIVDCSCLFLDFDTMFWMFHFSHLFPLSSIY